LDLRQEIRLLRKRFWVVVACAVVGAATSFVVSLQLPKVYEAKASLIAQTMANTYAEVATSRPVLEFVISQLALPETPETLVTKVDAKASQTSAVLTITGRDSDPSRAAAIANAIADRLLQLAPDITGSSAQTRDTIQANLAAVQAEIDQTDAAAAALSSKTPLTAIDTQRLQALRDQIASLLSVRSSLLNLSISYSQTLLTLVAPAVPPRNPSSPTAALAALIGGLGGLAIGIGIVLVEGYARNPPEQAAPGFSDP
jgi:uncharacterized protein involved in exopolysaccharide biosynthesis